MKSTILTFILGFVSILTYSQNVNIKGNVVDANTGNALPGVNIVVKNTSLGSTTDFDGNFTLSNVAIGKTLVFSYIGYLPKEILISNSNFINVTLKEDTQSLEEVVVVGYGTQKKSVVTGAISSVKAKDIENLPSGRIEQALQGRTSGVIIASNSGQPGSSSTVRVRGITTFDTYGGNNPLWVVDGVIVDSGGIGYLNQSDIESIEVLKDAASLAIYGARAASGVIMVTTKKGKSGKISINYTGFTGVSAPAKKLKLLNATQYAALMNEKSVAAGGNVLFPDLSIYGVGTDWQEAIFNDSAQRLSHEISLNGGNDISNFYASFGLTDQQGIVMSEISNYNKKNLRLNSTHKLSKFVTVGQTLGYAHQKIIGIGNTNSEFGGPLSSAINLDPITPVVVTDPVVANGSLYTNPYVIRDKDGNPYGISPYVGQEMTNPLAYAKTRLGNYGWSDDIVGNAFIEITPIEGLKLKTSVGAKLSYWGAQGFTPKFYLSPTVNSTVINTLNRRNNKSFGWNVENTLTYSKKIDNHNFTLLLGQGADKENQIWNEISVTYKNLSTNDYKKASFNDPTITLAQREGYTFDGYAHILSSVFSRLNYDYKEKYLFTGIIRRDGSSRFGSNKKYGVFPSFSVGWIASKENFWKENEYINTLKIRGGYGITGNDAIPNFGYLAVVAGGRNYTIGDGNAVTTGSSPGRIANPDLHWEETAQTNIGFETKVFDNFNVTFDWYKKISSGILRENPIPGYVGAEAPPFANIADMNNTGVEIEISYKKKFNELNFSSNANFSTLKNEVTFLGKDINFITDLAAGFQSMGPITRTQVGQSYNSFYGFQTDGIFQNMSEVNAYTNSLGGLIQPNAKPGDFKWVDANGDGTINNNDKVFLGSPLPKITFGFTINMDYKGFDLMAFAQGAAGNKIFQGLRRLDILNGNYQTDALSRWTGEGTSNNFPRLTNTDTNGNFGKMSNFYLENGDYLRFKVVQFGYTIPNSVISKSGLEKVRLYLTGENLLTLTKYTGFDPEIGGNVLGIDRGYYPQARSFMFGANLQF
ncbi:MAG: TonB-dependent receptor [Flavobacteriaceae bacterium]|nr:TonB-dependent receptor [Flavobacteriaceae bacterium]